MPLPVLNSSNNRAPSVISSAEDSPRSSLSNERSKLRSGGESTDTRPRSRTKSVSSTDTRPLSRTKSLASTTPDNRKTRKEHIKVHSKVVRALAALEDAKKNPIKQEEKSFKRNCFSAEYHDYMLSKRSVNYTFKNPELLAWHKRSHNAYTYQTLVDVGRIRSLVDEPRVVLSDKKLLEAGGMIISDVVSPTHSATHNDGNKALTISLKHLPKEPLFEEEEETERSFVSNDEEEEIINNFFKNARQFPSLVYNPHQTIFFTSNDNNEVDNVFNNNLEI